MEEDKTLEEDKALEALFEEKLPTEELMQEARVASRVRQVTISLGTLCLVGVLVWLVHLQLTPYLVQARAAEKRFYENVAGANRFEMPFEREITFFNGKAEAVQYKILGSTPVVTGKVTIDPKEWERLLTMTDGSIYSETGHRQLVFYRPSITSEHVRRETQMLREMEGVKLAEVAISLKMPVSRSELEGLLPAGVSLNWAWIDTTVGVQDETVLESQAIGYPLIDEEGKRLENPEGEWIKFLDLVRKKSTKHQAMYETLYLDATQTQQILGGVVVGTPEALEKLDAVGQIQGLVIGETLTH